MSARRLKKNSFSSLSLSLLRKKTIYSRRPLVLAKLRQAPPVAREVLLPVVVGAVLPEGAGVCFGCWWCCCSFGRKLSAKGRSNGERKKSELIRIGSSSRLPHRYLPRNSPQLEAKASKRPNDNKNNFILAAIE